MLVYIYNIVLCILLLLLFRHNCEVYGVQQPESHCICADVYTLLTALLPSTTITKIQDKYQQSLLEGQEEEHLPEETATAISTSECAEAALLPSTSDGAKTVLSDETATSSGTATAVSTSDGAELLLTEEKQLQTDNSIQSRVTYYNNGTITKVKCTVPGQFDDITTTVPINEKGIISEGIPIFPGGDISSISEEAKVSAQNPDLIILSPPWGGPDYLNAESYCLYTMLSSGCGQYLAQLAAAVCPNLLYLIPVNTNVDQVHAIAEIIGQPYVIEYILVNHSPKLMAVYMGPMVGKRNSNIGSIEVSTTGTGITATVPECLPDVISEINSIVTAGEKSLHKHFDD